MISLQDWQRAGSTMNYRGHAIFWRAAGPVQAGPVQAPVLLLIHGFPTASWDWEAVWEPLAERYRVLTLDMIGFGFSAKPSAYDYSIADQANIFEQFLREQAVQQYHILAHDYGDTVAQELLARQHDGKATANILSVCFLNGGLFPETHQPLLLQKLLLSPLGSLVARLTSRNTLAASMRRIFGTETPPSEAVLDAFWALLQNNRGVAALPRLIHYMTERKKNRGRWVGALQKPGVPLKLIDGGADPISGRHMAERYRELVPNPDITLLDAIGHYPQVDAPAAVLRAYQDFRDGL